MASDQRRGRLGRRAPGHHRADHRRAQPGADARLARLGEDHHDRRAARADRRAFAHAAAGHRPVRRGREGLTRLPRVVSLEARSVRVTARTVWTFARLVADDGSEGWGEASLEGRSAEVEAAIRAFPLPIELGAIPTDLVNAAAYSAIEQALWDLRARMAGQPLAEILGGVRRDPVPLYANINRGTTDRSPGGFAARAAEAVALGFGAIKIAP